MVDWRQGCLFLSLLMPGTYHGQGELLLQYSIHTCTCKRPKAGDPSLLGCMGAWLDSVYAFEPSWYEDNSHGALAAEA